MSTAPAVTEAVKDAAEGNAARSHGSPYACREYRRAADLIIARSTTPWPHLSPTAYADDEIGYLTEDMLTWDGRLTAFPDAESKVLGYLGLGVTHATIAKIATDLNLTVPDAEQAVGNLANDLDAITRPGPDTYAVSGFGETLAMLLWTECPV